MCCSVTAKVDIGIYSAVVYARRQINARFVRDRATISTIFQSQDFDFAKIMVSFIPIPTLQAVFHPDPTASQQAICIKRVIIPSYHGPVLGIGYIPMVDQVYNIPSSTQVEKRVLDRCREVKLMVAHISIQLVQRAISGRTIVINPSYLCRRVER